MTLDEVDAFQSQMPVNSNKNQSTAVGRYQFLRPTLLTIRKRLGLRGGELFDPDMQDRLTVAQLDFRKIGQYRSGSVTDKSFQVGLADEWASIPDPVTGKSRHKQRIGISNAEMQTIIHGLNKK